MKRLGKASCRRWTIEKAREEGEREHPRPGEGAVREMREASRGPSPWMEEDGVESKVGED